MTRLQWQSLQTLSRWRVKRPKGYRNRWRGCYFTVSRKISIICDHNCRNTCGDHVTDQDADDDNDDQEHAMGDVQYFIAVERTRRNPRKAICLTINMIVAYALSVIEEAIMSTYREAEINSEFKTWKDIMMEEMSSLYKNDTSELSELLKRKKAIDCKWVFAKKQGSLDGDTVHYKARLVAKGYAQQEGIDYNEVFLPVVKHSSIRILLALVA